MNLFMNQKAGRSRAGVPALAALALALATLLFAACPQDSPAAGPGEQPGLENPDPEHPGQGQTALPPPPAGLALEGGAGWILARWQASPGSDVSSYEISYGTERTAGEAAFYAEVNASAARELYIAGLSLNGRQYFVFVTAKNSAGTGAARGASVTTLDDPDNPDAGKDWRPFTGFEAMGAWLASQPENTAASPYYVSLKNVNLGRLKTGAGADAPFGIFFDALAGRYAAVNVDACTGATAFFSARTWIGNLEHAWRDRLVSIRLPLVSRRISYHYFVNCTSLERVALPPKVQEIGEECFMNAAALTEVVMPATLTKIENQAFKDCALLRRVVIHAPSPPTLGNNVFAGTHTELSIQVPPSSVNAYKTAFGQALASRITALD